MMSCDNRNRTPAVCVSCAPANRTDASRSTGTPSIDDDEFVSCSGVASALERYFNPLAAELAMSLVWESRGFRIGICTEGDHNYEHNKRKALGHLMCSWLIFAKRILLLRSISLVLIVVPAKLRRFEAHRPVKWE